MRLWPESARERWAVGLTAAGLCWAFALVPAALLVPVYRGGTLSASGAVTHTSSTLVAENGARGLVAVAIPAVLAAIVWFGLRRGCSGKRHFAMSLARAGVILLAVFTVLGAASIGLSVLPVALALGAATALTTVHAERCTA